MKFWQILALLSGAIIAVVMALASISYNATLGTGEPAFRYLPITNTTVFSSLALAFDLGMIASIFGFWHWWPGHRVAAVFCAILFVIASAFSVHSVRGYIALNVTKSLGAQRQAQDVYTSLAQELTQAQEHVAALRAAKLKARRRKRSRLQKEIEHHERLVRETRDRLAQTEIMAHVSPVAGLEWFLAVTLWFFHATCWTAWFGSGSEARPAGFRPIHGSESIEHVLSAQYRAPYDNRDSVSAWLGSYEQKQPQHCAQLYARYAGWCTDNDHTPLTDRQFYTRLIALGAHKFRDGRDGPMLYALPRNTRKNARLEP